MNKHSDITINSLSHLWYRDLAERVGMYLAKNAKDDSGQVHSVYIDPMNREGAFLMHANGIADTVIQLHETHNGRVVVFQPAIPQEVTAYETDPPIKTRTLNCDDDLDGLADAIAYLAPKDFFDWQAKALLEAMSISTWRSESTAFLASLKGEPWCPTVSVSDDGSVKASVGRVLVKANPGKLTITFAGPATEYLDVIRGVLRDEHRFREEQRATRDAQSE